MTQEPVLLNPSGELLEQVERRMVLARKTKPIWAKQLSESTDIETLEGRLTAEPGDYLCRGIQDEQWPQKANNLFDKYVASEDIDADGWQRFDPKADAAPVEAAAIEHPFRVIAQWGELNGKANDYVVRSTVDPTDVWIVDRTIFEASYEFAEDSQTKARES